MATKTLYVGNLPYSVGNQQLADFFSEYGASNPRVIEGRGFGFVDVEDESFEAAVAEKHNAQWGGRTITVNEARPREERSGGGGGGGGGRPSGNRGYGGGGGGRGGRW